MTEDSHPVDDALRRFIHDQVPGVDERRRAEARLRKTIHSEINKASGRSRLVRWALAMGVVVVGILVLFEVIQPSVTVAAIEDIAKVVEVADPLTVPEQNYIYTKSQTTNIAVVSRDGLGEVPYDSENLVYLLPTQRETWVGSQGAIQLRTTAGPPIFFRPEDEQTYYAAALDQTKDRVGQTITQTVIAPTDPAQWPADQDELNEAIRVAIAGRGGPEAVEYIDVALDLLREQLVSPHLRANTLRLIGQQRGLEVVKTSSDGTTFAIDYSQDEIQTRLTFTISASGYLLWEDMTILENDPVFGIPKDTAVSSATYSPQLIVDNLDTP